MGGEVLTNTQLLISATVSESGSLAYTVPPGCTVYAPEVGGLAIVGVESTFELGTVVNTNLVSLLQVGVPANEQLFASLPPVPFAAGTTISLEFEITGDVSAYIFLTAQLYGGTTVTSQFVLG